jgi:hypothetical protein
VHLARYSNALTVWLTGALSVACCIFDELDAWLNRCGHWCRVCSTEALQHFQRVALLVQSQRIARSRTIEMSRNLMSSEMRLSSKCSCRYVSAASGAGVPWGRTAEVGHVCHQHQAAQVELRRYGHAMPQARCALWSLNASPLQHTARQVNARLLHEACGD